MQRTLIILALLVFPFLVYADDKITLQSPAGIKFELTQNESGWSLGSISLHGKQIESPLNGGVLILRSAKSHIRLVPADTAKRIDERTAELTGKTDVDGVALTFQVRLSLDKDAPVIRITPSWKVEKDLPDWEVGFTYQGNNFTGDWRAQHYPFAGNSEKLYVSPLRYCGVPGVLLYKTDLSTIALYSIDSRSDYLNPKTWTGKTWFYFENGKGAPVYYAGSGGKLETGIDYELPLQLILDDSGKFASGITNIMTTWRQVNDYKVETDFYVRTPQEAFELIANTRPHTDTWKPGMGYEHHKGTPFVYLGNTYIAYGEYQLFTLTGEKVFRDRAIEQIDFTLKGQQPSGVFHTSYYFKEEKRGKKTASGFCSWDWYHDGYKVDINVFASRYILQMWQLLKEREGIDRKDWYDAAIKSLDWALAQQNEDGGFPQCVEIDSGKKSISVVSGRTMVALPIIAKITGDEKYLKKALEAEKFLREKVENRFWFTGMHPDLPPEDYEQDSFWAIVQYWLDKYERTGEQDALDHAIANANLALLSWCPKQLSWVKNPTQGTSSEQQHYNEYTAFSYGNEKLHCLSRLYKHTKDPLFSQLLTRMMQNQFFMQVADGPYKGGMYAAISDPWLERKQGFNFMNVPYTSETVLDLVLELIEMDLVKGK